MQNYGIIQDGKLIVVNGPRDSYKPIECAAIPDTFDQLTQYAVQADPIDNGYTIVVGVEIKDVTKDDTGMII